MRGYIKIYLVLSALVFSAMPVFAEDNGLAKLSYGEDRWITLHFLLQAQIYSRNEYDSAAGETESDAVWAKGFQVRRSRIILNGQATKNIEFFMETDDILIGNQGSGSQYSTDNSSTTSTAGTDSHSHTVTDKDSKGVYTQDAYINYKFAREFEVAAGLILLPFMHHNRESAVSQLGVDYNSTVIPLGGTANEWRDTGLEIRGLLRRVVDYRIGVFRGQSRDLKGTKTTSDDINPYGYPRYTGRLQINFADPETGFFYSGNYLGKKSILAIGGGMDYQNHASRIDGSLSRYFAWTGDATIDYKVSDDLVVALQGAYVNVKNKPGASVGKQSGYFAQLGLLIGSVQPVIKYQYWKGDTLFADDIKTSYITGGVNYFISGHNANIKAEYQNPMSDNKAASGEKKATLQLQIFL